MKINAIKLVRESDLAWCVNIEIEKKELLYLHYQGLDKLSNVGDCVALFLFLESMVEGSDLILPKEYPVSKVLVKNLYSLQEIYIRWFPYLKKINITSELFTPINVTDDALCLFSGGVDSMYTFLENKADISHLLLCIGLDIQLSETTKKQNTLSKYTTLAKEFDKKLLVVTTNLRDVFPQMDRILQHGALLSALVLAAGKGKLYIPASHNMDELFPWGSHPLTDPLFSNGCTDVIHHGAIKRSEKTEKIATTKDAGDLLRVCNSSDEYNCGQCEKCLRTMFVFAALNRELACLPALSADYRELKKVKIYKESQRTFWQDNYDYAVSHNKLKLASYANKILLSYHFRKWLKDGYFILKKLLKII